MRNTYDGCLADAQQAFGENWYKHCQILRTMNGRFGVMWVVRAYAPLLVGFRRV